MSIVTAEVLKFTSQRSISIFMDKQVNVIGIFTQNTALE